MRYILLIVFFSLWSGTGLAQETDSAWTEVDSTEVDSTWADSDFTFDDSDEAGEAIVYTANPDTVRTDLREFDSNRVDQLKSDPNLDYQQPPTVAESFWDRFWQWIGALINDLINGAVNTDWGRVTVYIIALAVLVVVIMMLLKVDAFKVLYAGQGKQVQYQVLDENIHEMDFEKLLQEAAQQGDYRKGIRLLFLYALKLLSDKHLVNWEPGKTNHEYVAELTQKDLRKGLNELSFYFDYAWYGNFRITADVFKKAEHTFSEWKGKIS